jgi:hypothetical protein
MVNEQRAWGSHPHWYKEIPKENQDEVGRALMILFKDPRLFWLE